MPIRRYRHDPRSEAQRGADEELLVAFGRGDVLRVPASTEQAVIEALSRRQGQRRQFAGRLGVRLGLLRRGHGISQRQLARVLRTTKGNVSRLESGREGGLTIERLLAVEEAVRLLSGHTVASDRDDGLISVDTLDRFRTPSDALEVK